MDHYRAMYFNNPKTGYYTIIGTYKLFPKHARMPSISEDDHIIMAATDILEMFKQSAPVSAIEKQNHCKMLRSLTGVLTKHQTPRQNRWTPEQMEDVSPSRMDPASNSRVNAIPTLRVGATPTTYVDPKAPEAIRTALRIHQQNTRNNTPLPSMQAQQPTTSMSTPSTATNLLTPVTDIPTIPVAPRRTTNNKNGRHRKRVKEREKKITKILQKQLTEDKQRGINLLAPLSDNVPFIYNMPNPKGGQKYHPNVTQDDWDKETTVDSSHQY